MEGQCYKLALAVAVFQLLLCDTQSQETFPFVEFFDTPLSNNSWIGVNVLSNISGLRCVTDLGTCCSSEQGESEREWVLPNGTRLIEDGVQEISSLGVRAGPHKLGLVLTDPKAGMHGKLDGVYECVIDTSSGPRQSYYIGLYNPPHGR